MNASEDRYRILLEYASDGIVSIDGQGKIVEFNKKAEEIFQYTKDEVIGNNLSMLIPQQIYPVHKKGISHLVKSKQSRLGKTMEVVGIRKDGTLFPHEISISSFMVDGDAIFTAIIRDISERKEAEEMIRQQNEELILLNAIARIIGQSIDLKKILSSALGFIMDTSNAEVGAIFLPENSHWSLAAYKNTKEKSRKGKKNHDLNPAQNIIGDAAQQGEIIISHTYSPENHRLPELATHPSGLQAFMCLPLKSKNKVVGILFIGDGKEIRFKKQDQELLKSIGNTIGVAVENARLFEEVKNASREIAQERAKLEHLTLKLIVSQEEERRKISRELHDEAGQLMSTLKINLEMIGKNLPTPSQTISSLIQKSTELVDQTSCEIKRICTNLHPSVLDSLGLRAALSSYIDGFQNSYGIRAEFNSCELEERLPLEIEQVIYRVVQESLNNIAKHARAPQLSVNLIDTPSSIITTVEDNGVGFDVKTTLSSQEVNRGLGLLGIKERVSLVRGKVTIKSASGRGTVIRLEIPKKYKEKKSEKN